MGLAALLQAPLATTPPHEITVLVLGVIGVLFALLAQTGAFFYWGGQLKQAVLGLQEAKEDHERRLACLEDKGSPVARTTAEAVDKEYDEVQRLMRRLEDHIAALGQALVRTEGLERRTLRIEERCDSLHPPATATQRMAP